MFKSIFFLVQPRPKLRPKGSRSFWLWRLPRSSDQAWPPGPCWGQLVWAQRCHEANQAPGTSTGLCLRAWTTFGPKRVRSRK